MSLIHRMSEPVRTPVRRFTNHYAIFFEDLIHAVKNEIVGKIDRVDRRVEDVDRSMTAAYESVSDQLAIQTATIRTLRSEVARLQSMIELDGSPVLDLDSGTTPPSTEMRLAEGSTGPAEG
ncbi:MAG: hypothetical protein AAF531_08585 [Actinomycetota bacterium]